MKNVARTPVSVAWLVYILDINSPVYSAPQCGCSKEHTSEEMIRVHSVGEIFEWTHVETQIVETRYNITFCQRRVNVLQSLVDTDSKNNKGAKNDGESLEENISVDCDDIISQMRLDLTDAVGPTPHENNQYEMVRDIMSSELPSTSTGEEAQEEPMASSKHSRRCLKGVRKHIRNMFRTLCCWFPMTCRKRTSSR